MISQELKEELEDLFDYYETVMEYKFIDFTMRLNNNYLKISTIVDKLKLKHEQLRHNAGELNNSINENIKC